MTISRDDVTHVARLARLSLSDDEVETYTEQLGAILGHAETIAQLDLADVAPTAHPIALANVLRDDVVGPTLARDAFLPMAPAAQDDAFRIPPILGEAP